MKMHIAIVAVVLASRPHLQPQDGSGGRLLDPDAHWGWVLDQGATMIQTDYAAEMIVYLMQKGRRNF